MYQEIANNVENIALLIGSEGKWYWSLLIRIANFVKNCFCVALNCFVWFKVRPAGAVRFFCFLTVAVLKRKLESQAVILLYERKPNPARK